MSTSAPSSPALDVYRPNREEAVRQDFVLALKLLANGPMQARVRHAQESAPAKNAAALARTTAFREWAVLTHRSQSLLWQSVEPAAQRAAEQLAGEARQLATSPTLHLKASLDVPAPIANTEIHRQPGGYTAETRADDVLAGTRYLGAGMIYSSGKGDANAAPNSRGNFLLEQLHDRFRDLQPRRILEIGCGTGVTALGVSREFPAAEYHALDVAAGLVRFGHLLASRSGSPIHFHQLDAADTGFPAGHFDLIISNIVFHETNDEKLIEILRECRRVLAPEGAMLNVDVATQVTRLGFADRVMNDWQVIWNGEPFWKRFAERNLADDLVSAGFERGRVFAEHVDAPIGLGAWYVFGVTPHAH